MYISANEVYRSFQRFNTVGVDGKRKSVHERVENDGEFSNQSPVINRIKQRSKTKAPQDIPSKCFNRNLSYHTI